MNEELKGKMERRITHGVVPVSTSTRNSSGKETVARSKQQWMGSRRGRSGGQYPSQDNQRYPTPKSNYDRRDVTQFRRVNPNKQPRAGYQNVNQINNNAGEVGFNTDVLPEKETNSKKNGNSLNYLLNFKYAPRERSYEHHIRTNSKRNYSFNKERFLQANCQFVVSDSADYIAYAVEPDILVDWTLIEQVRIFSHEVSSCPICLFPPVAAKITRCGHVYCWSCILHYLSLSEKAWHKCPICFESVTKKDLKSVVAMENHHFAVGQTITMRLMKKAKHTTLVLPQSQWRERELMPFKINDSVDTCYSKLLLASPGDVLQQIVEQEETALSTQLMEAKVEQSPEICFIEIAQSELKARKDELQKSKLVEEVIESIEKISLPSSDEGSSDHEQVESCGWNVLKSNANCIQGVGEYEPAFSDDEEATTKVQDIGTSQNGTDLNIQDSNGASDDLLKVTNSGSQESAKKIQTSSSLSERSNSAYPCTNQVAEPRTGDLNNSPKPSGPPKDQSYMHYYFYQAEDGQNIFLHPINARCLIKEYGSLENCPEYISTKIVEMEAMSQTEELRKRFRYLSHLPLTCEFVICELELKPPVVSLDSLQCFRVEIQKRKQRRQKKMKVEKRRELRVDAKIATMEGRPSLCSTEPLNLTSEVDFPTQSSPTGMAMSPLAHGPGLFTQLAAVIPHNEDDWFGAVNEDVVNHESVAMSPPSFAQALRTGKAAPEMAYPVWKAAKEVQPRPKGQESRNDDDDDDDYIPPPTYQATFSDALSVAISEGLERHLKAGVAQEGAAKAGGGKRQKKSKKKLLFTTGHMKFN